jgi:dTDP-4-dehydrorhamnose reductase
MSKSALFFDLLEIYILICPITNLSYFFFFSMNHIPGTDQNRTILITGSNGLLGQKLVELLSKDASSRIIATSVGKNRLPFTTGYVYYSMDVTNTEDVENVIKSTQPDTIIHTAAMTNVDQCELEKENCWKLNVTAVENLINACKKHHIYLQHLSTDFVFDGVAGPYVETDAPNPISFYGWSKFAAERLIQNASIRWAIVRTVLVYGTAHDMSRSNIILWVKKSLENKQSIRVVTDQYRTPTLAEDLATGCTLIANLQQEGIFHISGDELLTPYQMAIKTAKYFQLEESLIQPTDASQFTQVAKRPPVTGFDIRKAKELLSFKPHRFEEGIEILMNQMNAAEQAQI